jgi:hypothetical protein
VLAITKRSNAWTISDLSEERPKGDEVGSWCSSDRPGMTARRNAFRSRPKNEAAN